MKRHPALAPLSRDHHHAPVIARRLRHAGPEETAEAAGADPAVAHALGARLSDHVKLEEHELFPLIERTVPEPALAELDERLCEHAS